MFYGTEMEPSDKSSRWKKQGWFGKNGIDVTGNLVTGHKNSLKE